MACTGLQRVSSCQQARVAVHRAMLVYALVELGSLTPRRPGPACCAEKVAYRSRRIHLRSPWAPGQNTGGPHFLRPGGSRWG